MANFKFCQILPTLTMLGLNIDETTQPKVFVARGHTTGGKATMKRR